MAQRGTGRDEITVALPPEPRELNPEAAYALLKAHAKQFGSHY